MLGKDFFIFWQMARGLFSGLPFYSTNEALYPPISYFLFAPFGLLPFNIAFAIWTGINVVLFTISIRKLSPKFNYVWFLFTPTIFILMTGQIDIIFLFLSVLLLSKIPSIQLLGAVLLTIKPQIAFIILPWYIFRWLKQDRVFLLKWILACVMLHSLPLLADAQIYLKWFDVLKQYAGIRLPLSPGLFSLSAFKIPVWVLGVVALPIMVIGLISRKNVSISAQLLAMPMGLWYEDLFLIGSASWKILIPLSWAVFLMAYLCESSAPMMLLPLAAFVINLIVNFDDIKGVSKRLILIFSKVKEQV
jgi:hypothetical protein